MPNDIPPKLPAFPTEVEARTRADHFRNLDPFPTVEPALLNSADLLDYVATCGIFSPYSIPEKDWDKWVKPASCAVGCTGEALRFDLDKKGRLRDRPLRYEVTRDRRLELRPNSITYLHLGTTFLMPNYLAARFNLAIREIHRGILVGTGPLVDPGFEGQLLIPLHNLTSNTYNVRFGEPIVWVEFTKLSRNSKWSENDNPEPRVAEFAPFAPRKNKERKTALDYLDHANEGMPIASSIPQVLEKAFQAAEHAEAQVRNLRRFAVIAAIAAAIGVVLPLVNLVSDTNARVDEVKTERSELQRSVEQLERRIDQQQQALRRLRRQAASQ